MDITNGKYTAKAVAAQVQEKQSGAVMLKIVFDLTDEGFAGQQITAMECLHLKSGDQNDRTYETLAACYGWDKADIFWLEDKAMSGELAEIPVKLTIELESFTGTNGKNHTGPKVKWIDPLQQVTVTPEPQRNELRARLGKPSSPAPTPAPKPAPRSTPPGSTPPPGTPAPGCTMQEAWDAFCAASPGALSADLAKAWKDKCFELFASKPAEAITPQEWYKLQLALEDNIPF
jgi:hypothetical protein